MINSSSENEKNIEITPTFSFSNIKLVVGLGNIGREYEGTRHNIGFYFTEKIAGTTKFIEDKKLKSHIYIKKSEKRNLIFAKPTTFMNASGESVNLIRSFYKIEPSEILIIHDDLDISIGNYKIQFAKGPKVHNGIKSIENRLGTNRFWRLRLGVENRSVDTRRFITGETYVLSRFSNEENLTLSDTFDKIIEDLI